jgi:hypothetical protein
MSDSASPEPSIGPDFVQATETVSANPAPAEPSQPAEVSATVVPPTLEQPAVDPTPVGYPAPVAYPAPGEFSTPGGAYPAPDIASAAASGLPAPAESWSREGIVIRERVGRGLLFSLGAIVIGVALTMIIYRLGFIASITSFVLAYAAIWLYTLGAGTAPRKGVWAVLGVIVVGVALSIVSMVVTELLTYLAEEYPAAALADKIDFVMLNLGNADLWGEFTTDILMYVVFAVLGTFGLVRQLGRARKAA